MDPGYESVAAAAASVPVGFWSVFCTFSPTRGRCCILYTWRFPKALDSGGVVCQTCAPICVVCRDFPRCAVAGLAGSSPISAKETCLGPIGVGALSLLVGRYGDVQFAQKGRASDVTVSPLAISPCTPPARRTLKNFIPTTHGGRL